MVCYRIFVNASTTKQHCALSGYNLRVGKKGALIFDSKYLVLLERMSSELYQKSTPREGRQRKNKTAAKNNYIHLLRLWPKTGNTKIKQTTHPTSPVIGQKHILPVLAGYAQVRPRVVSAA